VLSVDEAVRLLRAGDVIAFPTETVYGVGCDAMNAAAAERVFALKQRPGTQPLSLHIADGEQAEPYVSDWGRDAAALAEAFWPGPLAIIVRKAPRVPAITVGGGDTVALRCPDQALCRELIRAFGGAIAATSANLSSRVSPTDPEHVRHDFPDLPILDDGPCRYGVESTVLDLSGDRPAVLRHGALSVERIESLIGRVDLTSRLATGASAPLHLSTPVRLVSAEEMPGPDDPPTVILALDASAPSPHRVVRMPSDAEAYARRLYPALREADVMGWAAIAIQKPMQMGGVWRAIHERLERLVVRAGSTT
jgi:L-threonylcarbamoyladenylate synthase